jgi:scyllo-inositol 2-dehydrogenase (NADP+)
LNSDKKIRVAIVGAGNISNTRHIPALKKQANVDIVGVVGIKQKNIDRTLAKWQIPNSILLKAEPYSSELERCEWFKSVDAVVIGAPPKEHYPLAKAALVAGKHVLLEKPMTMNTEEADELIDLARTKKRIFCVMHNFQFTSGIQKLERVIAAGGLGEVKSFYEVQLTNKFRRLPEWYNDLPLGLFYDEAPHFMYMLETFGGKLEIQNAYAHMSEDKAVQTPVLLNVSLKAGKYPASIFLNFESPVCEWYFIVAGSKKIAYYDLFKDILIVIPTDNEHYAPDILRNSWLMTWHYWLGFVKNGFKMVSGNLLYGHEVVVGKFIKSVETGAPIDPVISGESGKRTVEYMNDIADAVKHSRKVYEPR